MLKKLIKHEFIATYRTFGILLGGLIALAVFARLSMIIGSGMFGFAIILYVLALISSFVVVLVFTVRRYYQSLLSDQAYLTLMLPANAHQHLLSKIIVTVVWYIGLIAAAFLSLLIVIGSELIETLSIFVEIIGPLIASGLESVGLDGGVLTALILLTVAVMGLFQLMMLYLCATIGGQSGKNKRWIGIALYFGLTFGLSMLMSVFSQFMIPSTFATGKDIGGFVIGYLVLTQIIYLLAAGGCYFFTAHRLTHNFNLQ